MKSENNNDSIYVIEETQLCNQRQLPSALLFRFTYLFLHFFYLALFFTMHSYLSVCTRKQKN